jgi:D-lactate dehydrogenase (cytochrome)
VAVPLSELPGAIAVAREAGERLGLRGGILGHVGDGNFHYGAMVDPENEAEIQAFEELSRVLVEDALARGGTCTGEHGIGAGKLGALEREHGDLLPLLRGVKALFDPHGIMNPGKAVPPAG